MQTLRGTPHVVEEILKLLIIVSSECISERIVEQHVDVFVQQVTKEIIEFFAVDVSGTHPQPHQGGHHGYSRTSGFRNRLAEWSPKEPVVAHWWQGYSRSPDHGGDRADPGADCMNEWFGVRRFSDPQLIAFS